MRAGAAIPVNAGDARPKSLSRRRPGAATRCGPPGPAFGRPEDRLRREIRADHPGATHARNAGNALRGSRQSGPDRRPAPGRRRAGPCASSPRAVRHGLACAPAKAAPRSCPGSWAAARAWLRAPRYAASRPRSAPPAPAPARSARPWRVSRGHPDTSSGCITRIYPCQPKSTRSSTTTHNMCHVRTSPSLTPHRGGEQLQ